MVLLVADYFDRIAFSVQFTQYNRGIEMSESISKTAGVIWNYLDNNGPTTVSQLTRNIKETDKVLQRGIGWLAREDKIIIETINRAETLSLK
jgi:hypothetical protein